MKVTLISEKEVDALLDAPYNPPVFTDSLSSEDFSNEYWGYHAQLVKRVYLLGHCSNFLEDGSCCLTDLHGFTMNEGFGDSRCFDIELNDEAMLRPELIPLVQQTLAAFATAYQVTIHHDLLDFDSFDIIVTSDDIKAWAKDPNILHRFTERA